MQTHSIQVMQHRDDSLPTLPPTLQQSQQVVGGALIQGGERLIEQNDVCVLQKQPRKNSPLELTDGEFSYLTIDKGFKADRRDRLMDACGKASWRLAD